MNDAVDRVLRERAELDRSFPGGLTLSTLGHVGLVVAAVIVSWLAPHKPPLEVVNAFAVALPRGGGGVSVPEPPAPAPPAPAPEIEAPPAPAPEPPPKIVKPPKEEPPQRALPDPTKKPSHAKAPAPVPHATLPAPSSGIHGGTSSAGSGRSLVTPGLEFGPPGPGVPGGTDSGGDWYLASVQQKIWTVWAQQLKASFAQPIGVSFTILADGSVTDVHLTQPSGADMLDFAAKRAIYSAAPFAPLPKHYGTSHYTIQAIFKPIS